MAKVKSIIMEKDIGFLSNVDVHFVSLVGHAANRQPFKIIKGEVIKGDKDMTKQTIYKVLVKKGVTDNKLQELMTEHKFSVDQKDETALEGYDVYKQAEDAEVDLDTRNMAFLSDDAYVIIADLKEDSEKEGLEKIDAVGKEFDPVYHEAIMRVPSDAYENDVVAEELQAGYQVGDKIIRPTMVKVACND